MQALLRNELKAKRMPSPDMLRKQSYEDLQRIAIE